jgi:hypothetical protein
MQKLSVNNSYRQLIVVYIVTDNPPTAKQLIYLFSKFFTPELEKKCHIIHCDRTRSNVSHEFREFLNSKNIALSYTTEKNMNQVVECNNKVLEQIIAERKFDSFPDELEFEDLPEEFKNLMIAHVVEVFNTMKTTKSSAELQGYLRILIDLAKELIRLVRKDIADKSLILAKADTELGKFITTWTGIVLKFGENNC